MGTLRVRFSQSSERRGVFNYALKVEVVDALDIPSKIFVYHQSPAGINGNTFAEFDHVATPVDFQEIPEDAASETVPWYRTDNCIVWFRCIADMELAKQLFVDDINALRRTFDVLTSENNFARQTTVEFSGTGVHQPDSQEDKTILQEIETMKGEIAKKVSKDAMSDVEIETNTVEGVRATVQNIGKVLGAKVVVSAAIMLLSLCMCIDAFGAGFSGERFGDIDLDENPVVVTNVTFDGLATLVDITNVVDSISTNFVPALRKDIADASKAGTNYVDSATNDVLSAAQGYTDAQISEIPPPDFSMNNTELVETIEAAAPRPGDYAAVSNAAMSAKATLDGVFDPEQPTLVPYAGRADNAQNAASLDGRDGGGIITQLNAATTTNALQGTAIAGLTQNLATNYYTAAETDDAIDSLAAYYITYTAAGAAFPALSALTNATVVYSGGAVRTPTRNDYAVVLADEAHGGAEWRYIYTVAAGATSGQWDAQYPIDTNDYDGLSNKPQINGVSLFGNKTGADLGVLDLAGGTVTGGIAFGTQDEYYGYIGLVYDGEDHRLRIIDVWNENQAYIEVPNSADGSRVAFTDDISAAATAATNYTAAAALSATNYTDASISATSPAFSNAVLAVGLGIDTNTVAAINELVDSSQGLPVSGMTSVGALLLALAAAIAALKRGKADKSDVDPLLFAQYYPDGSVKSAAEFTPGIKYDDPDTTNRTITVKPFCSTGTPYNDNSLLVGRVVIPPFVDAQGDPYISDDGTRYKVVGVSGTSPNETSSNLTDIIAPNTVTSIGQYAFDYCEALTTVSLPAVTTILDSAFNGCSVLTSVDFGATPRSSVPALGINAFYGVPNTCKIIVPYTQYDAWTEASGWSDLPQDFVRHAEKSDKPATFTTGNLAEFDANGNPTDSGVKPSDKLDSTSAAPAFSSDSSVSYAVGSHCTYNGKLYKCTTATTGGTWVAESWAEDTMTDPDAALDITAQNQLRVIAKDGTVLWAQGYNLASTSSATLACDATNNFTFADGATTQAFALPTAPTGKVGDFGLDIDNSANTSAATMTLTGLDTIFSVVVPQGESLNDMLAIAAGELAQFYITLTTFRVNNLPTWHILKQVVENGGATA